MPSAIASDAPLRRRVSRLAAALAALLALAACHAPATQPHVVLIVLDTLRADRLGSYGNGRGLTPFLDYLAGRGTRFANAYAPSSWTCPSVASLFTSRYPGQHGVTSFGASLSENETTLAERLTGAGYDSAGFTANFRISESLGYAQGFGSWTHYFGGEGGTPKERGPTLRADSMRWLSARTGDQPLFLYLQYMEPHIPYMPPEPFLSRFARPASEAAYAAANDKIAALDLKDVSDEEVALLESLYDGETASLDEELRLLFDQLERRGTLRNAVVIVTADHGEEFREHGLLTHGLSLYESAIRVPLILLAPGFQAGTVVEQGVSLIDLAPTILELVGAAPEPRFVGRSLVPLLTPDTALGRLRARLGRLGGPPPPPDLISELYPTDTQLDLRIHRAALLRLPRKLIVPSARAPELYDLAADPGELAPQTVRAGGPGADLYDRLEQARAAMPGPAAATADRTPAPLDDATREKLRALGYKP